MGDERIMSEIIEVPLPRAISRRLISFLIFHISMFFSASLAWGALILEIDGGVAYVGGGVSAGVFLGGLKANRARESRLEGTKAA